MERGFGVNRLGALIIMGRVENFRPGASNDLAIQAEHIVNEIGARYQACLSQGNVELARRAEQVLLAVLTRDHAFPGARFGACCYLAKVPDRIGRETVKAIRRFLKNRDNAGISDQVLKRVPAAAMLLS